LSIEAVPNVEYRREAVVLTLEVKNPFSHPIGGIKVALEPRFLELFAIDAIPDSIGFLKPGEKASLAVELRPKKGDIGRRSLTGSLEFVNSVTLEALRMPLPAAEVEVWSPLIVPVAADDRKWDVRPFRLASIWQTTARTWTPVEELYAGLKEALGGLGIYMLTPTYRVGDRSTNAIMKLYGEEEGGERHYWLEVELFHEHGAAWMSLKAYSEDEKALLGFYNKALDLMDAEVDVRMLIEQKREEQKAIRKKPADSPAPEGSPACPACGKEIGSERACVSCGAALCVPCDDRIKEERRRLGDSRTSGHSLCMFCRARFTGPAAGAPGEAPAAPAGSGSKVKLCVSCGAKYEETSKDVLGWKMCKECLDKLGKK